MKFVELCIYLIISFIGGIIYYIFIKNNNIYHGPNSKDFINKIYLYNNNYYIFEPEICICPLLA